MTQRWTADRRDQPIHPHLLYRRRHDCCSAATAASSSSLIIPQWPGSPAPQPPQRPARTLPSARAARACAARARGGVLRRCGQHGPPTLTRSSQRRARGREQGAAPLGRASYRYHLHHLSPTGCAPSRYHQVTIVSARSAESTSKLALLPPPPPRARPWCLPRPRGPGGGADKGASAGARTRWRCARCRCTRRGTRAR